jgi:hypothetical protein
MKGRRQRLEMIGARVAVHTVLPPLHNVTLVFSLVFSPRDGKGVHGSGYYLRIIVVNCVEDIGDYSGAVVVPDIVIDKNEAQTHAIKRISF